MIYVSENLKFSFVNLFKCMSILLVSNFEIIYDNIKTKDYITNLLLSCRRKSYSDLYIADKDGNFVIEAEYIYLKIFVQRL